MALDKGPLKGSNDDRVRSNPAMRIATANSRTKDPFAGLEAGRNAQRAALASYIAKTKQGVEQANMGDMGDLDDDLDRETAYRRQRSRQQAATRQSGANSGSPTEGSLADLLGGGGMSEDEIRAQAASMFKPQFDYLAGLENAAKSRHKASDTAVAQIYAALQQQYVDDRGPTSGIYNAEEKALRGAYDEGVANIGKAQDETAARTAAMMKKLGIEQAGAELFKDNVADAQAAQQRLISQKSVDLAGNASTEAAALADLGVKRQAAGLQGAEQRSDLQMQLADIMAGYGMKRADLSSQQASAAVDIRNNQQSQQQEMMKMLAQQQQQDFMNELAMGKYDLDRDKFEFSQQQAQQKAAAPMSMEGLSPYERFNATAAQMYQNPTSRANAIGSVEDAFRMYQRAYGMPPSSLQELIEYLEQRNPNAMGPGGDIGNLRNLASLLWQDRY